MNLDVLDLYLEPRYEAGLRLTELQIVSRGPPSMTATSKNSTPAVLKPASNNSCFSACGAPFFDLLVPLTFYTGTPSFLAIRSRFWLHFQNPLLRQTLSACETKAESSSTSSLCQCVLYVRQTSRVPQTWLRPRCTCMMRKCCNDFRQQKLFRSPNDDAGLRRTAIIRIWVLDSLMSESTSLNSWGILLRNGDSGGLLSPKKHQVSNQLSLNPAR